MAFEFAQHFCSALLRTPPPHASARLDVRGPAADDRRGDVGSCDQTPNETADDDGRSTSARATPPSTHATTTSSRPLFVERRLDEQPQTSLDHQTFDFRRTARDEASDQVTGARASIRQGVRRAPSAVGL